MAANNRWKYATIGTGALLLLSLLLLPACCCVRQPDQRPVVPHHEIPPSAIGQQDFEIPEGAGPEEETQTEMKNVHFWLASDLILNIRTLRGVMRAKEEGHPVNFDDKTSFVVEIHDAEVGVSAANLEHLMNRYVFTGDDSPLRNLSITIRDGVLHQEGILHKVIDIPFQMDAQVQLTSDGKLRLHPESIEICELPGKPLMRAFSISLEEVMELSDTTGVTVEGNDLIIDPLSILPPPAMQGTISDVRLDEDELVMIFSSDEAWTPIDPPRDWENYMFFRHGTLRMGKLFMVLADMQVVDADPEDPFEFFLDIYNKQLVAGYTENLSDYGLLVVMRDIDDIDEPLMPRETICHESPCQQME